VSLLELSGSALAADPTPTNFGDNYRTGWYANQPSLTADSVRSNRFGVIFSTAVDGPVMSQPLVAKNRLIATTTRNSIYALDPVSGAVLWQRNLGTGFDASLAPIMCSDLKPLAGGLSTPVVDTAGTGTVYTTVKVGAGTKFPYGSIVVHALDLASGSERKGFPLALTGAADNASKVLFHPIFQLQRPGLLLQDGSLYIGSGGMCDVGEYRGWVFRVTQSGRVASRWVAEPASSRGAGIWQSGAGLATDGSKTVLVTTGNAMGSGGSPSGDAIPGHRPPSTLGESVVRLAVTSSGKLKATDFFAPSDAELLDRVDADLASGGPVLLPSSFGTAKVPRLLAVVGKSGTLFLLDRDSLGGFRMGPSGSNAVVSRSDQRDGVFGKPSIFGGDGGWLYATTYSRIDAYRRTVTDSGTPAFTLCSSTSSDQVGIGSSSPVVTSSGSSAASALFWSVTMPFRDGNGAQLRVYAGNPSCGAEMKSLRSWAVGRGAKYAPPGVGNGRIYVGTSDGHLIGFGQPAPEPVNATGNEIADTVIGESRTATVTLTASVAEQIKSVSVDGDSAFSLVSGAPSNPVSLAAGGTISLGVKFAPAVVGKRGANLRVSTSLGDVVISLSARGRSATPYMSLSTQIIGFGALALQKSLAFEPLIITNDGLQTLNVTDLNLTNITGATVQLDPPPTLPFSVGPGLTKLLVLRYHPETEGLFEAQLQIATDGSEPDANRTVLMTGFGAKSSPLQVSPQGTIDFGRVKIGTSVKKKVTFTNGGEIPVVTNKYKPPVSGPISLSGELDEGSAIQPHQSVAVTLTFKPTALGSTSRTWYVTASDGAGPRVIVVKGTGIR